MPKTSDNNLSGIQAVTQRREAWKETPAVSAQATPAQSGATSPLQSVWEKVAKLPSQVSPKDGRPAATRNETASATCLVASATAAE